MMTYYDLEGPLHPPFSSVLLVESQPVTTEELGFEVTLVDPYTVEVHCYFYYSKEVSSGPVKDLGGSVRIREVKFKKMLRSVKTASRILSSWPWSMRTLGEFAKDLMASAAHKAIQERDRSKSALTFSVMSLSEPEPWVRWISQGPSSSGFWSGIFDR